MDADLSVLNVVTGKKKRKIFLVSLTLLCLIACSPKEQVESTNFPISLKKTMSTHAVSKLLNTEGKKRRIKAPKSQRLVTPRILLHQHRRIALKKQSTEKNKEEAAECAELSAKRKTEAKEKCQEWIAKRCRLSSAGVYL